MDIVNSSKARINQFVSGLRRKLTDQEGFVQRNPQTGRFSIGAPQVKAIKQAYTGTNLFPGQTRSIQQAVRNIAEKGPAKFGQEFGQVLRGQRTAFGQTIPQQKQIISRVPVLRELTGFASKVGEAVTEPVTQLTVGATQLPFKDLRQEGIRNVGAGGLKTALGGVGLKILSPATVKFATASGLFGGTFGAGAKALENYKAGRPISEGLLEAFGNEAITSGVRGVMMTPILKITQPLIAGLGYTAQRSLKFNRLPDSLKAQVLDRVLGSTLNVAEGLVLDKALGLDTDALSFGVDAATGAIFGTGARALSPAQKRAITMAVKKQKVDFENAIQVAYKTLRDERGFAKIDEPIGGKAEIKPEPAIKPVLTKDGKIKVQTTTPEVKPPDILTQTQAEAKIQTKKSFNVIDYIKQNVEAQKQLLSPELSIKERYHNFIRSIKTHFIDPYVALYDKLDTAVKQGYKVDPERNINDQISRVMVSDDIAYLTLRELGFEDVIFNLPKKEDIDGLGEYLIAKRNLGLKTETGRSKVEDKKLVDATKEIYEPIAKKIQEMYRYFTRAAAEAGLIDKKLAEDLIKENPDYVRFERLSDELEGAPKFFKGKPVASLSKQTILYRLKGSKRVIQNPLQTLIDVARKITNQIERNKAANILVSYKDIPGNPYGLARLRSAKDEAKLIQDAKSRGKSTIYLFKDGVKEIWEVNKEVAEAAKNLNNEQMSTLLKIMSVPVRVFKISTTSLSIPFQVVGLVRDQVTAFINSDKVAKTSLLNPMALFKALFETVKQGKVYDKMVENGALFTSFDIYRGRPTQTLEQIYAQRNVLSKIAYTVTNPVQLFRAIENVLSKGEQFTRIQQYIGRYDAAIKEGYSDKQAEIIAARAARQNTADFRRIGTSAKIINMFIPYFSAGIAGARSLVNAFSRDPVGTSVKFTSVIGLPMIASTLWNTSDEKRKQIYDDLPDFEKENNFIFIPDGATRDERNRWNIIKIPLPPGLSNLSNIVRNLTLSVSENAPLVASEILTDLLTATTSLTIDKPSTYIPQIIKPAVEVAANKDLFTNKEVVPNYMKNLPKDKQVYTWTSGTIRKIAEYVNMSPLQVEKLLKGYGGGTIMDAIGIIDRGLASQGVIPQEQAQRAGVIESLQGRFGKAYGGESMRKLQEEITQGWSPQLTEAYDYIKAPKTLDDDGFPAQNIRESMTFANIRLTNPQILEREAREARLKFEIDGTPIHPMYDLPFDRQMVVLNIKTLPPGETKSELQKQNIEWLKLYWAQVAEYSDRMKKLGIFKDNPNYVAPPRPTERAQSLMDQGIWNDPEVQQYLEANKAYKNNILKELGLPSLEDTNGFVSGRGYGGFSRFRARTSKPKKVSKITIKKARVPKGKKFRVRKIKTPKIKEIKAPRLKALPKSKRQKIKVKLPKFKVKA